MNLQFFTYPDPDSLNVSILHILMRQRAESPGSELGVGMGWSGPKDLFHYEDLQPLITAIQRCIPLPCKFAGWGNILDKGGFIRPHDHHNQINMYSGVYYLTKAVLGIRNPHNNRDYLFEFNPGDGIIFHPSIVHFVTPTSDYRVSVAFNGTPR